MNMANGSYVVRQSENLLMGYVVTCCNDGVISNIQVRVFHCACWLRVDEWRGTNKNIMKRLATFLAYFKYLHARGSATFPYKPPFAARPPARSRYFF